jgi:hypothetical protein
MEADADAYVKALADLMVARVEGRTPEQPHIVLPLQWIAPQIADAGRSAPRRLPRGTAPPSESNSKQ